MVESAWIDNAGPLCGDVGGGVARFWRTVGRRFGSSVELRIRWMRRL